MTTRADLHTHSKYSDGTLAPAELVRRARAAGVASLVLTDHDTVSGCAEARAEAARLGLRFGCGIEINTREGDMVHILGYGIDPERPALAARLAEFRRRRAERVAGIVARLNAEGVALALEEVRGEAGETLGRPHIADALRRKRLVRTRAEAFARWLTPGRPGYVEPMGPSAAEAIAAIREAGGWACLAHPLTVAAPDWERLVALGLEGLEVHYLNHTGPQVARLGELARRHGLLATGGSDFHGPGSGREDIGGVEIPEADFDRVAERLKLS